MESQPQKRIVFVGISPNGQRHYLGKLTWHEEDSDDPYFYTPEAIAHMVDLEAADLLAECLAVETIEIEGEVEKRIQRPV